MLVEALAEFGEFALEDPRGGARFGDCLLLGGKLAFQLGIAHFKTADRDDQLVALGGKLDEFPVPEMAVEHAGVGRQRLIAAGLRDLAAQRIHPPLLFGEHVGNAQQVRFRKFQLPQRFLFLALEFRDPGGLLKHRPALLGLGGQDLVDLPLRHDRVGGPADSRIHQQIVDVLQAAERAVDPILRTPVAEYPAGQRDLVEIDLQRAFTIRHREGHFGHPERLALFRAVENDVGHFAAAECFGRGFTEHPADRVDDVGLAAAIRADDAGHALGEFEHGLVRERLEAMNFESFQIHSRQWG